MLLENTLAMVNQPDEYRWATSIYKKALNNSWFPDSISMKDDISQWNSPEILSPDERLAYGRCIGFFAGSESLVSNNLLLNIARGITSGSCRNYISRQGFEESLHNETITYICESLMLDRDEIYQAFKNIPSIKAKDDFLMSITSDLSRQDFDKSTLEGKKELLRNIIIFYIICEGILFYSGFVTLLAFKRQGKMPGTGQQMEYTMRDEALHLQFGVNLVNTIKYEYPELWDDKFVEEVYSYIRTAMNLESDYAKDILPRGILGLNSGMLMEYVKFICNRRLQSIGLQELYPGAKNPFMWLGEADVKKQANFFEDHVNEYKNTMRDDF